MITVSRDGQFVPAGRRCKAVEVQDRDAVHRDFADLYHAPQVDQGLVIELILSEQLRVVPEVAQKPAELPHGPGGAVQAKGHEASGQILGVEDSETDLVIGFFLCQRYCARSTRTRKSPSGTE